MTSVQRPPRNLPHASPDRRPSRRELLAGTGGVLAGGFLAACGGEQSADAPRVTLTVPDGTAPTSSAPNANPAQWLIDENARPAAGDWTVPDDPSAWSRIRGYADVTSVDRGGTVDLRVSTEAPEWRLQAFRTGWYGGGGARLVWESPTLPGERQDAAVLDAAVGTWRAPWRTNLEVPTDDSWPPGMYLLKLTSSDGGASFVPLVVRDDASTAAIVIQSSVTTWQAYNEWGGKSLYADSSSGNAGRADVVTFDRPYYRNGSGEFFGREFEMVMFAERNGYDVTYWTDVDLHATPERLTQHRALISLGHDEYYSTRMRRGLEAARDAGVNLVFMGANAIFRKIRLEDSDVGSFRDEVNYRDASADPITATDPTEATVSWRQSPVGEPESSLIGNLYESNPVDADMVVVNTDNWLFEGSGLRNGDVLPGLVANEYDRVTPEQPTPDNIEVFCHSPVTCRGKSSFADVTWYSHPSGAGVFAVGTFEWIKRLIDDTDGRTPSAADPPAAVQAVTRNLFDAVSAGPAGATHPSTNNLAQFGIRPGYVTDPPPT
jgi:hypothetical protein